MGSPLTSQMIRAVDDRLDSNIAFLTVEEVEATFNPEWPCTEPTATGWRPWNSG